MYIYISWSSFSSKNLVKNANLDQTRNLSNSCKIHRLQNRIYMIRRVRSNLQGGVRKEKVQC